MNLNSLIIDLVGRITIKKHKIPILENNLREKQKELESIRQKIEQEKSEKIEISVEDGKITVEGILELDSIETETDLKNLLRTSQIDSESISELISNDSDDLEGFQKDLEEFQNEINLNESETDFEISQTESIRAKIIEFRTRAKNNQTLKELTHDHWVGMIRAEKERIELIKKRFSGDVCNFLIDEILRLSSQRCKCSLITTYIINPLQDHKFCDGFGDPLEYFKRTFKSNWNDQFTETFFETSSKSIEGSSENSIIQNSYFEPVEKTFDGILECFDNSLKQIDAFKHFQGCTIKSFNADFRHLLRKLYIICQKITILWNRLNQFCKELGIDFN